MILAACATRAPLPEAAHHVDRAAFDALFEETMARYRLPGLALGIIVDGEVAYVRTAGETVAGSGRPITPRTLFRIASLSKAMTAAVLARLVQAGALRWDDPVVRHLPAFRMHDPWVTREMQVRDLLIHNSGLRPGAGDLMLWPEPNRFTRADLIAGLAHLQPLYSFRSRYTYDNLLYVVAGEVAAAVAGVSYEELVQREVFAPVGMTGCRVGTWRLDEVGDVAQPHMQQEGRNIPVRLDGPEIPAAPAAAAGGIRCSLEDLLRWTLVWLHPDFVPPGASEPWLNRAQREASWSPQMPLPLSQRQREWQRSHFHAYGYGWRLSDANGTLKVAHTGTLMGMYSALTLLPEKRAGFVILTNGNGADARTVLEQALIDLFTAPERSSSLAHYAHELEQARLARLERRRDVPEPLFRQPVQPDSLAQWLGVYRDPWFGEVRICEHEGRVRFSSVKSPRLTGEVMQAGGRLLVDWYDESVDVEPWLRFEAAPDGGPVTLTLARIDARADHSYDYEDLLFTRTGGCGPAESAMPR